METFWQVIGTIVFIQYAAILIIMGVDSRMDKDSRAFTTKKRVFIALTPLPLLVPYLIFRYIKGMIKFFSELD